MASQMRSLSLAGPYRTIVGQGPRHFRPTATLEGTEEAPSVAENTVTVALTYTRHSFHTRQTLPGRGIIYLGGLSFVRFWAVRELLH